MRPTAKIKLSVFVSKLYMNMRRRNRDNFQKELPFSRKEFIDWLASKPEFLKMFMNWESASYDTQEYPSIDRINSSKPYMLSNMQLLKMSDHRKKTGQEMKTGKLYTRHIPVIRINPENGEKKHYIGVREAGRDTGCSYNGISKAAKGEYKSYAGYLWSLDTKRKVESSRLVLDEGGNIVE